MPDNILKATISVVAPNVAQTASQVAAATDKMESGFEGVGESTKTLQEAFSELKKSGLVNIGAIQDAIGQFKQALKIATDPADIKKLNQAIAFLTAEEKTLRNTGIENHFEGVSRGTLKAQASVLSLSHSFGLLPPEIQHLTHSFDGLIQAYEQIRGQSGSTGEALKGLASALIGPVGIGIALTVGAQLLTAFGLKLFESEEATKASEEALKAYGDALEGVKKNVSDLSSELEFLNQLSSINAKVFKIADVTDLNGQVLAQRQLTQDFKDQREKLLTTRQQLLADETLNDKDLEKAKEDNQKAIQDLNEKIIQSERTTTILYRQTALQRVQDTDKANDEQQKLNDKFINDTIAKAKRLASFLDRTTIRSFKFEVDPEASKGKTFNKAIEFIDKALDLTRRHEFEVKPQVRLSFDESVFKNVSAFVRNDKLVKIIQSQAETLGTRTWDQTKKAFEESANAAGKSNPIVIETNIKFQQGRDFEKRIADAAQGITDVMNSLLGGALEAVGESIGEGLAGRDFAAPIIAFISAALSQIGKALIAFGLVKSGLDKVLKNGFALPGAVAIGLGVTAIALAALIKSSKKSISGFREKGGPVQAGKTFVVGERGPELFVPNTGGTIVPNNKIPHFSGMRGMAGQIMGQVEFLISGNNLKGVFANATRSQNNLV